MCGLTQTQGHPTKFMPQEPIYFWEIEFIPEDRAIESLPNHEFTGTRAEVEAEAKRVHPDYQCEKIVLHRRGQK